MTLREILKSLNLIIEKYDAVQELKVVNVDNFCLYRLLEYLRSDAFKDDLPDSIFQRKKNPFPKTHHPYFAELIANKLQDCLKQDSILLQIFDKDALNELIKSRGKSYQFPWFGQLMSGPQLLAYIYTLHVWLSDERIQLDIS